MYWIEREDVEESTDDFLAVMVDRGKSNFKVEVVTCVSVKIKSRASVSRYNGERWGKFYYKMSKAKEKKLLWSLFIQTFTMKVNDIYKKFEKKTFLIWKKDWFKIFCYGIKILAGAFNS